MQLPAGEIQDLQFIPGVKSKLSSLQAGKWVYVSQWVRLKGFKL